jgi:hypothetical protein
VANQNFKVKKGLEVGTGVTISDGNINISGIITAQFSGDGSALTGVTAAGSGVVVQEEGSNIGTAATINFIGSNVTAALSGGIANVTVTGGGDVVSDTTPQLGGNLDLNSKDITGTGNISITGGFNATGVSTFQENVNFTSTASFGDNDKINLGTGNDLQIFHDGTSNIISDAVGAGISLVGNTKVVGVLTATGGLQVPGGTGVSNRIELGNNQEFTLQYNTSSTRGVLTAPANNIEIQAKSIKLLPNLGENGVIVNQNGSVELYYDNFKKFETTGVGVTVFGTTQTQQLNASGVSTFSGATNFNGFSEFNGDVQFDGNIDFYDSVEFKGTSGASSVHMYDENAIHFGDQNDGKIIYNNTGNIVKFERSGSAGEIEINATPITLKHTSNTKLQTTSTGVVITGVATATSFSGSGSALTGLTGASAGTYGASTNTPVITVDSDGRITGIATVATSGAGGGGGISNIVEDTTPQLGGNLDLNSKFITGTGNIDITGYAAVSGVSTFSGSVGFATHIHDAGTGGLDIRTNLLRIKNDADSETLATFAEDGAVSLYHDNALRLATTNTGVSITDNLNIAGVSTFQGNVNLGDNDKAIFGAGGDLEIYHDGINSYVQDTGTGNLILSGTRVNLLNPAANETMVSAQADGPVELYYDNSKKLETTNTGVTVAGTLAATAVTGDGSGLTNLPAPGISTSFSNVQVTWSINSSGTSAYTFTGPGNDGSDNNPDIYLIRGQRYRFTNNSGGSHPFQIRSSPGGSAYSTGVTNNGGASGNIDFNVQHDAPERLYYQCTSHSAMVGNIYIVGASDWRMTNVATNATPEIYTNLNVGIGTDNPATLLHLEAGWPKQTIKSTNLNTAGSLVFDVDNVNTADFLLGQIASKWNGTDVAYINFEAGADTTNKDDGIITFLTSASGGSPTERLRIDSSGRLLKSGQAALTSTSLNHPIQVTAASDANAIAIIGRASDDIGELSFYEADKSTKLGEVQYRPDHVNIRCRVGDIRFASGGTAETLRIDGVGRIAQGGRTPTSHGSPNLLLWGADTTLHLTSTGSVNNSSFTGIKFAVAGGSTGDYSKAGIFVQRQDSYNDLDMIFAFRSTNDAAGVAISDEKLRIQATGGISFNGDTAAVNALDDYEEGTWTIADAESSNSITSNAAWYIKIGSLVHIRGSITVGSTSDTGRISLTLPFTSNNSSYYAGEGYVGYTNYGGDAPRPAIENGGTRIYFYSSQSNSVLLKWNNVSGSRIDFSATYQRT